MEKLRRNDETQGSEAEVMALEKLRKPRAAPRLAARARGARRRGA